MAFNPSSTQLDPKERKLLGKALNTPLGTTSDLAQDLNASLQDNKQDDSLQAQQKNTPVENEKQNIQNERTRNDLYQANSDEIKSTNRTAAPSSQLDMPPSPTPSPENSLPPPPKVSPIPQAQKAVPPIPLPTPDNLQPLSKPSQSTAEKKEESSTISNVTSPTSTAPEEDPTVANAFSLNARDQAEQESRKSEAPQDATDIYNGIFADQAEQKAEQKTQEDQNAANAFSLNARDQAEQESKKSEAQQDSIDIFASIDAEQAAQKAKAEQDTIEREEAEKTTQQLEENENANSAFRAQDRDMAVEASRKSEAEEASNNIYNEILAEQAARKAQAEQSATEIFGNIYAEQTAQKAKAEQDAKEREEAEKTTQQLEENEKANSAFRAQDRDMAEQDGIARRQNSINTYNAQVSALKDCKPEEKDALAQSYANKIDEDNSLDEDTKNGFYQQMGAPPPKTLQLMDEVFSAPPPSNENPSDEKSSLAPQGIKVVRNQFSEKGQGTNAQTKPTPSTVAELKEDPRFTSITDFEKKRKILDYYYAKEAKTNPDIANDKEKAIEALHYQHLAKNEDPQHRVYFEQKAADLNERANIERSYRNGEISEEEANKRWEQQNQIIQKQEKSYTDSMKGLEQSRKVAPVQESIMKVMGTGVYAQEVSGEGSNMFDYLGHMMSTGKEIQLPGGEKNLPARYIKNAHGNLEEAIKSTQLSLDNYEKAANLSPRLSTPDSRMKAQADAYNEKKALQQLTELRDKMKEAGLSPEEQNNAIKDTAKAVAWTSKDTDIIRKTSTGEIKINPGCAFGQAEEIRKQIMASDTSDAMKSLALHQLDQMRAAMAKPMEDSLLDAKHYVGSMKKHGSYREFASQQIAKGITNRADILDAWAKEQQDRNFIWKAGDAITTGVNVAISGTAESFSGAAAAALGGVGADSSSEYMAAQTQKFGKEVVDGNRVANNDGLKGGGYQALKKTATGVTNFVPTAGATGLTIGTGGTLGLILGAAYGGTKAYGDSFNNKIRQAEAEQGNTPLTTPQMLAKYKNGKNQGLALLDGAGTAAASYYFGKVPQGGLPIKQAIAETAIGAPKDFVGEAITEGLHRATGNGDFNVGEILKTAGVNTALGTGTKVVIKGALDKINKNTTSASGSNNGTPGAPAKPKTPSVPESSNGTTGPQAKPKTPSVPESSNGTTGPQAKPKTPSVPESSNGTTGPQAKPTPASGQKPNNTVNKPHPNQDLADFLNQKTNTFQHTPGKNPLQNLADFLNSQNPVNQARGPWNYSNSYLKPQKVKNNPTSQKTSKKKSRY